ncbi:sorbose reductase sou1 [Fusarium beomiforme]|uniref:Sorbose reductase sou1 n=1 Tax=Fusarium beomiforme TaxID=44412 RepID=A0A9P5E0F8_9HYPO|nr:sorbose reductase sou1 [Fusarium beomiforme]
MSFFVEFCIFSLGITSALGGLLAILNPQNEHTKLGISEKTSSDDLAYFAPIYMLAVRDMVLGLFILAFQAQHNLTSIATIFAVMSFMKFGDLIISLAVGNGKNKAHSIMSFSMGIGLLGWVYYLGAHY